LKKPNTHLVKRIEKRDGGKLKCFGFKLLTSSLTQVEEF
jgi:hypothetical protein